MSLKKDIDELETSGTVGDWCFSKTIFEGHKYDSMWLILPKRVGDNVFDSDLLHIYLTTPSNPSPDKAGPLWEWDGNREKPTLKGAYGRSDSIKVLVEGGAHVYLRNGELVNA